MVRVRLRVRVRVRVRVIITRHIKDNSIHTCRLLGPNHQSGPQTSFSIKAIYCMQHTHHKYKHTCVSVCIHTHSAD